MNKIIVVNKPKGYTSRDIVNIIGKKFGTRKVGHTGTLDPLAEGVLVVCINRYTKLVDMLTSLDKEYIAEIKLGIRTDTLDITGNVLETRDFNINEENISDVLNSFKGKYRMEVPAFSAIKVNGKKLYEYARENVDVSLPVKDVYIYNIELLEFKGDIIRFKCHVSKGTYIRSLIRDICKKLNVIGTMNSLVRTKQGEFRIEDAYSLEEIENDNYKLLDIRDAIDIEEYKLNEDEYKRVINGGSIVIDRDSLYILVSYKGEEIAIYKKDKECYKVYVMIKIKA